MLVVDSTETEKVQVVYGVQTTVTTVETTVQTVHKVIVSYPHFGLFRVSKPIKTVAVLVDCTVGLVVLLIVHVINL